MKQYETEVSERWGNTDAYREYVKKTKKDAGDKRNAANEGLMAVFAAFAACRDSGVAADSDAAQALVVRLQSYITEHFYTCTDEILAGFGAMYTADERFRENIDKYGEGTAAFASAAIAVYCAGRSVQ